MFFLERPGGRCMASVCSYGHANVDPLIKGVSAPFLHCEVTLFPFAILVFCGAVVGACVNISLYIKCSIYSFLDSWVPVSFSRS